MASVRSLIKADLLVLRKEKKDELLDTFADATELTELVVKCAFSLNIY